MRGDAHVDPIGTTSSGGQGTPGVTYGLSTIPSETGMFADLSNATASTINDIRLAFQQQKLLERDARGGTRYTELLRSHFQVISPDQRLQRPEFLGGGHSRININPVQQTSGTVENDPDQATVQGNLTAFGTGSSNRNGFTKSFVEHCQILGLLSVRADLTYQQGVNRMFSGY